jgi:hypothetical protein
VAFKTGLRIRPSVTTELRIAVLLEQHYRVRRPMRFSDLGRGTIRPAVPDAEESAPGMPGVTLGAAADGPHPDEFDELPPAVPPFDLEPHPVPTAAISVAASGRNGKAAAPAAALVPDEAPMPAEAVGPAEAVAQTEAVGPAEAAAAGPVPAPAPTPPEPAAAVPSDDQALRARAADYHTPSYSPDRFDASLAEFSDEDPAATTSVRRLNERLRAIAEREELPQAVWIYLAGFVRRAALFSVQRGLCSGWDAFGDGVDAHRLRTMVFPLRHPSIFQEALEGDVYVGRMPLSNVNEEFARRMGNPRVQFVAVAPVKIRDKVVTLLAAECETERALEKAFGPVVETADKLSRTLVRMILERKQNA